MNRTSVTVALLVNILASFGFEEDRSFPLPILPDVEYSLEDVIVLPSTADNITVLLVDGDTNLTLNVFNVTETDGFKLICVNCSVTSINRGNFFATSKHASIYLNISGSIVQILHTKELQKRVKLKNHGDKIKDILLMNILVYPIAANTSIKLCTNHSAFGDVLTNFKSYVNQLPDGQKCYEIKLSQYDGLVLNNTSLFDSVDISANDPLGMLGVSVTNISQVVSYNTQEEKNNQKRWHVYLLVKTTSNQFILIPSREEYNASCYHLELVSDGNTSVHLISGNEITYNLTNRLPDTFDLTNRGYLYKQSISFDVHSSMHKKKGQLYIVPLPNNIDYTETNGSNTNFQWIYVHNETDVVLACNSNTNVTLKKLFSKYIIEPTNITVVSLANKTTRLVQYFNLFEGIYRIRILPGIEHCGVSILHTVITTNQHNSTIKESIVQMYASGQSNYTYETIFYSNKNQTVNNDEPVSEDINDLDKGHVNIKQKQYHNENSTLNSTEYARKPTITTNNADLDIVNQTSYSEEITLNATAITRNSNATLEHLSPNTINSHFKVALQLTQSNGKWIKESTQTNGTQHKSTKQSKANEKDNLKYVIQSGSRFEENEVDDGKSLVAIIISLVAALVSAVVIILIFYLVEYCSKHNQKRRTRIRPFVSYY